MGAFSVTRLPLEGALVIAPKVFRDDRGFFFESYQKTDFGQLGIREEFVQDNQSCSRKGVVRGLHFQTACAQGKLVRVVRGSVYDALVDIRRGSPTYGRSFGIRLDSSAEKMVYVPVGFAHGFVALVDRSVVQYKTTDYYHPEYEAGIRWNDPYLGISWPLKDNGIDRPLISEKDAALPLLTDISSPYTYEGR